jgi:hypothetical protein
MQEGRMKEDAHQNEIINTVEIKNEMKEDTQRVRKGFELEVLLGKLLKTIMKNKLQVEEIKLCLSSLRRTRK